MSTDARASRRGTWVDGAVPTAAARREADEAAAASGIRVRELHTASDCRILIEVFNQVWSTPADEDLVEMGVLVALAHAGNYVALAERDGEPIGGGVGFFGPFGHPFHSHIVGVLPSASGRGVGRAIKLHQRAWCLDRDTTQMTWTYDPLVARNAYFNVRTLGAFPTAYHHDFYGPMDDGINRGQFTDRMVIGWNLAAPAARPAPLDDADVAEHVAIDNADDRPGPWTPPTPDHPGPVLVGVPRDIEAVRRSDAELAQRWRQVTRSAFTALLDDAWVVRDFRPSRHYVLRRESR